MRISRLASLSPVFEVYPAVLPRRVQARADLGEELGREFSGVGGFFGDSGVAGGAGVEVVGFPGDVEMVGDGWVGGLKGADGGGEVTLADVA